MEITVCAQFCKTRIFMALHCTVSGGPLPDCAPLNPLVNVIICVNIRETVTFFYATHLTDHLTALL